MHAKGHFASCIDLLTPEKFQILYFHLLINFKINFLEINLSGLPSEWHTVWIQIRPDILSDLIWVRTFWKGY